MGRGDWVLQVVARDEGFADGWRRGFRTGATYAALIIIAVFMVIVGSAMVLRG